MLEQVRYLEGVYYETDYFIDREWSGFTERPG